MNQRGLTREQVMVSVSPKEQELLEKVRGVLFGKVVAIIVNGKIDRFEVTTITK